MLGIMNLGVPRVTKLYAFNVDIFTPGGAYLNRTLLQQEIDVLRRSGYSVQINPFAPYGIKVPVLEHAYLPANYVANKLIIQSGNVPADMVSTACQL